MLDLLGLGQDFVDGEFFGRLPDHLVLLGKILWSEHIGSLALFEQEAAAENLGLGKCCGRHGQSPQNVKSVNHQGHEGSRRRVNKLKKSFVDLRVLVVHALTSIQCRLQIV